MGLESLLLPAGIALGTALIWTASFKGLFSRSAKSTGTVQVGSTPVMIEPIHTVPTVEPVHEEITIQEPIVIAPVASTASITEAPSPFDQPQTAFTNPVISSTALPTDVTAVTNIASPIDNAGPILVIARPKRARRTAKRLPTDGTPKRRRNTRAKASLPATESLGVTGQQNEINQ